MDCPKCSSKICARNGKNPVGHQKYYCTECRHTFCPGSTFLIPESVKKQCIRLYLEGMGFRGIGRHLGISYVSAYNYIKAAGRKLKQMKEKNKKSDEIPVSKMELDEIHTYVAKKKLRLGLDGG